MCDSQSWSISRRLSRPLASTQVRELLLIFPNRIQRCSSPCILCPLVSHRRTLSKFFPTQDGRFFVYLNLLATGAGHHRLFQEANCPFICRPRLGPQSSGNNPKVGRGISSWLSQSTIQCRATLPVHGLNSGITRSLSSITASL